MGSNAEHNLGSLESCAGKLVECNPKNFFRKFYGGGNGNAKMERFYGNALGKPYPWQHLRTDTMAKSLIQQTISIPQNPAADRLTKTARS